MDHTSIDFYLVIDTFLLLLIGIGPKIALVPFLEVTAAIDDEAKGLVVRKMLTTVGVVAQDSRAIKGQDPMRIAVFPSPCRTCSTRSAW